MWPSFSLSEGARLSGGALLIAACLAAGPVPPSDGPAEPERVWSSELVNRLKAEGWEPPYFKGTIRTRPEGYHLDLARRALQEPTEIVRIGNFDYRTSPALIKAGREVFRNYHFGTHLFWDFRRAIDYSTGITEASEYAKGYGVKRDKEGFFVGLVGVQLENGHVAYGHSCALCHANVDGDGVIVDGMANQDYDIGAYYDALRPKIKDGDKVFLGDAALRVLRFQGPGRTDPTMDGAWAPTRVPHLFALRAFEQGLRANGDMPNLWLQCYRNLNGSYAVDSEIMEALMAFLISIKPPANPHERAEIEKRGETVFYEQRCHRCHAPPYYSSGQVIDWSTIKTDPDRIRNGYPKGYKVASLLRVDLYHYYMHDGALTSLEQMFDPNRLKPDFEPPGIPPARRKPDRGVPGHEFGLRLSPEDRTALIAFLRSL